VMIRRRLVLTAIVLVGGLTVAGCQQSRDPQASTPLVTAVRPAPPTMTVTINACIYLNGKADRRCTPGVASGVVTQENLPVTICAKHVKGRPSWTETQRPPTSYTSQLRDLQMARYGMTGPTTGFREDHLISLELGGAPRDPNNLYPQTLDDSLVKDREENSLHDAVCAGSMSLADAQQRIIADWTH
jgi:hypothetical protein